MLGLGLGLTRSILMPTDEQMPAGYHPVRGMRADGNRVVLTAQLSGAGRSTLLAKVA